MEKLEQYLKEHRYSRRQFAKLLGTTPNHLGLLINGKATPGLRLSYMIERLTKGKVKIHDWITPEMKEEAKEKN